jgi:hypothetical protein
MKKTVAISSSQVFAFSFILTTAWTISIKDEEFTRPVLVAVHKAELTLIIG